jgi:hypothetical protein
MSPTALVQLTADQHCRSIIQPFQRRSSTSDRVRIYKRPGYRVCRINNFLQLLESLDHRVSRIYRIYRIFCGFVICADQSGPPPPHNTSQQTAVYTCTVPCCSVLSPQQCIICMTVCSDNQGKFCDSAPASRNAIYSLHCANNTKPIIIQSR